MHGGSRHGSRSQAHSGSRGDVARRTGVRGAESGPSLPDADRLSRLLEPVVAALGMDLEGVRVTSAGRRRLLRVVVDADGGVSLDAIALASRELSARLDGSTVMGELPYTLEVSSPGVDRPLTQPRHWRRATGRLVVVPLSPEADAVTVRVAGVSEQGVTLDRDGVLREYRFAELGPGRVQVEFGHFESGEDEEFDETDSGEED
jgi:ribosome maturation factor RimP